MSYIPTTWVDGETPVNAENLNKLEQGVADIHTAKENGELDGTPGKSAYQYAQDGGYTGTEADFAKKLAQEYPSKVSQLENDRGYITSEDIPDIPAGSGIHIGSEPPEDENVTVWIDTDEEPEASGGVNITAEVGQTIVVEEVDENGKPTKWKAMNFPEQTTQEILAPLTYTPTYESSVQAYIKYMQCNFAFENGKDYIVTFDGVPYTCKAYDFVYMGMPILVLGNKVLSGEMTSEPFAIGVILQVGACVLFGFDGDEHTISISKVNPDYRPFCIHIDYDVSGNHTATETSEEIIEAYLSGRQIIAAYDLNGATNFAYLDAYDVIQVDDITAYAFRFNGDYEVMIQTLFDPTNASWLMNIEITHKE